MPDPISNLEGTWQMLRAEFEGLRAPDLVAQKTTIEFRGEIYVVRFAGSETDRGTYSLGEESDNRTMTLHGKVGLNLERTIHCIYQLAGDRLRVCFGLDLLPTDFTTASKTRRYLAWYRRASTQPLTMT